MSFKRKRRGVPRFVSLHHRLLKSHAWHDLTPLQRCGYIELAQLYDGSNNGRLAMSARRLAGLMPCSRNSRVLQQLEDAGFIETVKLGKYTRKAEERTASEYRLTDFRCDVTGELPSRRYNERHRWEPCELKPKRKAMTVAERVRKHRKKRNGCNAERHNECAATVTTIVPDSVTSIEAAKNTSRKTAKNGPSKGEDVTVSVPTNVTLVHLTRGGAYSGTPKGGTGEKSIGGSNVVPLNALPPGHDLCKSPKVKSLPRGWHWCKQEQRVVTDAGIVVPIVDDPLVGTAEQRTALMRLREWEATHRKAAM